MTTTEIGLPLFRRGKVRDIYDLGDSLLMVASDRLSAFDVILPTPFPGKGAVLTQLSAFWFDATRSLCPNHLISADFTQMPPEVRRDDALRGRVMLVRRARRIDVECVARGYLAGSAWADYRRNGAIFGAPAEPDLRESDALATPLFTHTTKSDAGHDEPLTRSQFVHIVGTELARELEHLSLTLYTFARDHARARGILLADTKFEFGFIDDRLVVIDEMLTPDSSRFWDATTYAPGGPQASFDKQFVRDYLESISWNKRPPAPEMPDAIVVGTMHRYREAFRRITDRELIT
ncbi:MAG: phosphoribosylaminoimidazolesuccinocarboxamide synthase [Chloroflexi bacterium]|nr:phosphoribosylaminoimidazolesuccinocarboxamide synthase [Chloroflexota bacterium]